jgi:hypothetical protein
VSSNENTESTTAFILPTVVVIGWNTNSAIGAYLRRRDHVYSPSPSCCLLASQCYKENISISLTRKSTTPCANLPISSIRSPEPPWPQHCLHHRPEQGRNFGPLGGAREWGRGDKYSGGSEVGRTVRIEGWVDEGNCIDYRVKLGYWGIRRQILMEWLFSVVNKLEDSSDQIILCGWIMSVPHRHLNCALTPHSWQTRSRRP